MVGYGGCAEQSIELRRWTETELIVPWTIAMVHGESADEILQLRGWFDTLCSYLKKWTQSVWRLIRSSSIGLPRQKTFALLWVDAGTRKSEAYRYRLHLVSSRQSRAAALDVDSLVKTHRHDGSVDDTELVHKNIVEH